MIDIVDRLNKIDMSYSPEERPLYHTNCAEILLLAANERYKLGLDEKTIKAVRPFGGGMQTKNTCGALLGALAALGIMFTEDRPSTNEKIKNLTQKFVEEFIKEFGSIECKQIIAIHRSETEECNPVKLKTAAILEKLVRETMVI